nr:hypothetical protein CPGR_00423 [Mycolicibacter nonchromogenicus]
MAFSAVSSAPTAVAFSHAAYGAAAADIVAAEGPCHAESARSVITEAYDVAV